MRFKHSVVDLQLFFLDLSDRDRSGHVGAVSAELGAEIHGDQVAFPYLPVSRDRMGHRSVLARSHDGSESETVSSELSAAFTKLTGGLLSEEKQDAYDDIVIEFVRTDYIRYSSASKFGDDEKPALVKKLINDIETIENTKSEKSISAEKDTVTEKSNAKEDSENA